MIKRREIVSIFGSAAAILVICLPLHWGWVRLSDLGSIVAALVVAGSILAWGFRDRIERWVDRQKEPLPKASSSSSHEKLEQELTLLISPLYAKLSKNDEIIDFMTMYKISRISFYSDSQRVGGDALGKELEKLEEEIKEIMLQYGHLATENLYNLIKKFQDLEPDWNQENGFEAKKVLWEIKRIAKERQDELRTMLKNESSI